MITSRRIPIPYNFVPRFYQRHAMEGMAHVKRGILRWHRRAGKDLFCWNHMIEKAAKHVGVYWYIFPNAALGRRIIWDGIDKEGFAFMDHIPGPMIKSKNGTRMSVHLRNGSSIWILGADTMTNVGPNPRGVVFSEYSLMQPMCWDLIRPILAENNGWALFNFTLGVRTTHTTSKPRT